MIRTKSGLISILLATTLIFSTSCSQKHGQDSKAALRKSILAMIDSSQGKVGVAVMGLDFKDSLLINGDHHYPMQSVFKFPLAMAILKKVDEGKLKLSDTIHIPKDSLVTNTWSPMIKDFPDQNIAISLTDLIRYTVSKSDNNGCDVLFNLAGGTSQVNTYVHNLGVSGISIAANEREMGKGWDVQYSNWCQPWAMVQLLEIFYKGKNLSKPSHDLLWKYMVESENSPKRLMGKLPANTQVAHKTGTSNTNDAGITAATNDVGIVALPDGRHYAIVVYVSDCKGELANREAMIAGISKRVWDYFNSK
jgi:beta-lactamase class A